MFLKQLEKSWNLAYLFIYDFAETENNNVSCKEREKKQDRKENKREGQGKKEKSKGYTNYIINTIERLKKKKRRHKE